LLDFESIISFKATVVILGTTVDADVGLASPSAQ